MIRRVGIGIFILGVVITLVTTVNMLTRDKVVDIKDNEAPRNKNVYMTWTPVIGLIVMFFGGGVGVYGAKRDSQTKLRDRR